MLRGDARPSLRDAPLFVIENLLRLHQPGLTHLKLSARLSPRAFGIPQAHSTRAFQASPSSPRWAFA